MGLIIAMAKNIMDYGQVESLEAIYQRIEGVTSGALWDAANEILQAEQLNSLVFKPDSSENS